MSRRHAARQARPCASCATVADRSSGPGCASPASCAMMSCSGCKAWRPTGVDNRSTAWTSSSAPPASVRTCRRPSELRVKLDLWLGSNEALGPLIDRKCELVSLEPGHCTVGVKNYGRATTLPMGTCFEQVRSMAAAISSDFHRNVRCKARRAAFRPSPLNYARASLGASLSAGRSAAPVCLGRGSDLLRPREGSECRALRAPQPSAPGAGGVRYRIRCQEVFGARRRPGLCVLPLGMRATLYESARFGCCDPILRLGTAHASSPGFRSPWPNRTPQMVSRRLIRRGTVTSIEVAP